MSEKKQSKPDMLARINKRINDMKSVREPFLAEWTMCDDQYAAEIYEDNRGKLYVNNKMEQGLMEFELGRTAWLPAFDVKPDWYRVDVQKLEASRYTLDYFLDKEMFYKEHRAWRIDKGIYGTGIFYTGIRMEVDTVPVYGGTAANTTDAFFNNNEQKEEKRISWFFTPKNLPIRLVLFDDRVMWQSNFRLCEDCIMIELITHEELTQRYEWVKGFDQKVIEEAIPCALEERYYGKQNVNDKMIILYHYMNKRDKTYAINVNQSSMLYEGKLPYPDGELPIVVCQHYPMNSCLYGIGICNKVRMEKAYKNNMLQYIIDGARLGSGKLIAVWGSGESVDGDIFVSSGEISLARFTNSMTDMRDIDTRVDINGPLAVIEQIDKQVVVNTGLNLQSVFEPPAEQLGTVEIIEENKQIRNKSIDEARDHAIDDSYTKVLKNIALFAPELLKETKKVLVDGKEVGEVTVTRPQIQIPGVTIEKNWKQSVITKDMGNYGYLELWPETLDSGLCVRIVTANTYNSTMAVIEKNKMNEMLTKYVEMAQIPGMLPILQQEMPLEQILQKYKVVFWLDDKALVADTKQDKIRKENDEKISSIQALLKTAQNVQPTQAPGWEQSPQGADPAMWMQDVALWTGNPVPPGGGGEVQGALWQLQASM